MAREFDVTLAEHGFTIDPGSIQKADITAAIPRISVATDSRRRSDFSELDTIGQFTFHHGRGQLRFADLASFMESNFVDTRIQDQVIPAPLRHTSVIAAFADFNGEVVDVKWCQGHNRLYALVRGNTNLDNNLFFFNTATNQWNVVVGAQVLLQAANSAPTSLHVGYATPIVTKTGAATLEFLIISRNRSTLSSTTSLPYIYSTDGAVFTATAAAASMAVFFATWKEHIAYDTSNSTIILRTDPVLAAGEIQITNVGSAAEPITGLLAAGDILIVFKTARMLVIFANPDGTYSVRPFLDFEWGRDTNNGRANTVFNNAVIFSLLNTVYQAQGTATRNIGPEIGASEAGVVEATPGGVAIATFGDATYQSLLEDERGPVTGMVGTGNWLYAAMNGSAVRTILAYGGVGWHELTQLMHGEAGGVWYQPKLAATGVLSTPTLWYRDGEQLMFLSLPNGTEDRSDYAAADFENVGVPELITSWFDLDLPEVQKDWINFEMRLVGHWSGPSITVEYQVDEDTSTWYLLGRCQFSQELHFPSNTSRGASLRATSIRFRFTWNMTTSAIGPKLVGFFCNFVVRPEPRYGWKFFVRAEDGAETVQNLRDTRTAERLAQLLYELRSRPGPLRFDDGRVFSGLTNYIKNPSFEGWFDAFTPIAWTMASAGGGVFTTGRVGNYKVDGGFALRLTGTVGTHSALSDATPVLPAGSYHAVFHAYAVSGNPSYTVEDTVLNVLASGNVTPLAATDPWDLYGLPLFQRISVPITLAVPTALKIRFGVGGALADEVYLDDVEIREGEDDLSPFIGPNQIRCFVTDPTVSIHLTPSYRPPFYLCYVTTTSENLSYPTTEYDSNGEKVLSYGSRFSIELREAS